MTVIDDITMIINNIVIINSNHDIIVYIELQDRKGVSNICALLLRNNLSPEVS